LIDFKILKKPLHTSKARPKTSFQKTKSRPRRLHSNRPEEYLQVGFFGGKVVEGVLKRSSRELYVLPNSKPSERRTIVAACKVLPLGTVCPLTGSRMLNQPGLPAALSHPPHA
jgi:hypothetical protein